MPACLLLRICVPAAAAAQKSVQAALLERGDLRGQRIASTVQPGGAVGAAGAADANPADAFTPDQSLPDALVHMAAQAAIIFTGEVTAVDQRAGVVEVSFRVESAVRGATPGQQIHLWEWAGLWASGVPRYRRGQRLLVLLHAPSVAGFTSPVGGTDGLIPVHGDAATGVADLRWIATRVQRAGMSAGQGKTPVRLRPLQPEHAAAASLARAIPPAAAAADGNSAVSCALVLELLRAASGAPSSASAGTSSGAELGGAPGAAPGALVVAGRGGSAAVTPYSSVSRRAAGR